MNGQDTYVDAKGRVRWHVNDQIADQLKQLHDLLVIGGYDASHAARYPKLAHEISRFPESIVELYRGGRLRQISGIGPTIAGLIGELIETGSCSKLEEWAATTPRSVLELTAIPGLGAQMAKVLYQEHGITSRSDLRVALREGRLSAVPGIGKKTLASIERFLAEHRG
jgi:DNA polymerase (family 10)